MRLVRASFDLQTGAAGTGRWNLLLFRALLREFYLAERLPFSCFALLLRFQESCRTSRKCGNNSNPTSHFCLNSDAVRPPFRTTTTLFR